MKLTKKIILLPIAMITFICVIGIFLIENKIDNILQTRLINELKSLSHISLSTAALLKSSNTNNLNQQLSLLAAKIASASNASINYFSSKGQLIASSASPEQQSQILPNKPNLKALKAQRYLLSYYPQPPTQQTWVYFTQYDPELMLISQVSLPQNYYTNALYTINNAIIFMVILIVVILNTFAFVNIRRIETLLRKERNLLNQKIETNTQEITLIQTMTTMVNNADSIHNAGVILSNILPRLLPKFSGAIYLINIPKKDLTQLTYWGDNTFCELQVSLSKNNQSPSSFTLKYPPCFALKKQFEKQAMMVNLQHNGNNFGVACFYHKEHALDNETIAIIKSLSIHISSLLANILHTEQLKNQAIRDPLTNLYNRRFMQDSLEKAIHRAERHHGCVALLMIDLDYFKLFNDTFGHEAGDIVLVKVAHELTKNIRLEDIVCRYGGEEFCIICPDTKLTDAYHLAEKLRIQINKLSLYYKMQPLTTITMSIGVAIYPNHANSCQNLLFNADKALFQAKEQGRNCTIVVQNPSHESTNEKMNKSIE